MYLSLVFKCLKCAFLLSWVGMAASANAQAVNEPLWENVKKKGVLRCGAAIAPPYVMRDPKTGAYSGFFAELCRDFGQNVLKVKVQYVDTTWDNIVAGLQAGKWDLSLALNNTPERAKAVSFSMGASDYEVTFVYNKNNSKLAGRLVSIADIDKPGRVLTVMSGTTQDKAVSAVIKQAQLMRLPGIDETRLALTSKRADILVDASDTNWLFAEANASWAKTFTPKPGLAKQIVAFGVRKNTAAADITFFNNYLKQKIASGTVDKLIKQSVRDALKTSQ